MAVTQFTSSEYVTRNNVNNRITQINNDITAVNNKFPVSVANGGTGGTTASAARTNLEVMKRVSLYSNSSGTTSTIPLSDSIANYSKIGIYYYTEGTVQGCAYYTEFEPSVDSVLLYGVRNNDAGTATFLKSFKLTCSGTSITFAAGWQNTVKTNSVTFTADTASLAIYRVVGYKY